jgi:hypothetical protein
MLAQSNKMIPQRNNLNMAWSTGRKHAACSYAGEKLAIKHDEEILRKTRNPPGSSETV